PLHDPLPICLDRLAPERDGRARRGLRGEPGRRGGAADPVPAGLPGGRPGHYGLAADVRRPARRDQLNGQGEIPVIRTSTASAFDRAIQSMNSQQARLYQLQQQIATGEKLTRAADDPVAAAQATSVRSEITRIEVERRMVGFARTVLQQADTALGSSTDLMNSARDLVLQAGNATLTASDRASIASEIRSLRDELLTVANTRDGSGAFVFGGQGSRTAPFVETGGAVTYVADPGTQEVGRDVRVSTSLDGHAAFMSVPDGAGGRQSVFDVLDAAVAALSDPAATAADVQARSEERRVGKEGRSRCAA